MGAPIPAYPARHAATSKNREREQEGRLFSIFGISQETSEHFDGMNQEEDCSSVMAKVNGDVVPNGSEGYRSDIVLNTQLNGEPGDLSSISLT